MVLVVGARIVAILLMLLLLLLLLYNKQGDIRVVIQGLIVI